MKAVLYWKEGENKRELFSMDFDSMKDFFGLIRSIELKKPGNFMLDIIDEDGSYRKYIESGCGLDTYFNVDFAYHDDSNEHFDYDRFFPKENQDSTL